MVVNNIIVTSKVICLHPPDLGVGVVQHLEQSVEQLGQVHDEVDVGHGVQHRHPRHDELPPESIARVNALAQHGDEGRQLERLALRHYILDNRRNVSRVPFLHGTILIDKKTYDNNHRRTNSARGRTYQLFLIAEIVLVL